MALGDRRRRADCESWLSGIEADAMPSGSRTRTSAADDYSEVPDIRPPEPTHSSLETIKTNTAQITTAKEDHTLPIDSVHAGADKPSFWSFWSRRTCGVSMKMSLMAGVILLLLAVGGAVGGVLGARKKGNRTPSSPSPAVSTPGPSPSMPSNLFKSSSWYTLSTDRLGDNKTHYLHQLEKDTGNDLITVLEMFVDPEHRTNSDIAGMREIHYQLRSVPRDWGNSTYHPENWTHPARLYWISCGLTGPNERLTLVKIDWAERRWNRVPAHLKPADVTDEGQYFFFEATNTNGKQVYRIFNRRSGLKYPLKIFARSEARFSSDDLGDEDVEEWEVSEQERIEVNDGGFLWTINDDGEG